MAQQPTGGFKQPRAKAGHDVFTVLVILAFAFLLGTIIFVTVRSNELLGTPFPGFTG